MNYAKLQRKVQSKIIKFGSQANFYNLENSSVTKPWLNNSEQEILTTQSVLYVPHTGENLGSSFVSEENIKRTKAHILTYHNSVDISSVGFVEFNGEKLFVDWVQILKPANVILLYAFGVKK